MKCPFRSP